MKAVRSLTCTKCSTKYRSMFKKGGKTPARVCPTCGSDAYVVNEAVKQPENADAVNF